MDFFAPKEITHLTIINICLANYKWDVIFLIKVVHGNYANF